MMIPGNASTPLYQRVANFLRIEGEKQTQSNDAELNDMLRADRLHEECGVFGIIGTNDAAALTALGLHALQHRGQEAAGIATYNEGKFHSERQLGLVSDHFSDAPRWAGSLEIAPLGTRDIQRKAIRFCEMCNHSMPTFTRAASRLRITAI